MIGLGLLWALAVVVLALVTAAVAESKGQSGLLWFVLGMLFPLVSLLVAALLRPSGEVEPMVPSVEAAAQSSAVARALYDSPSRLPQEVTGLLATDERDVLRQLSALEDLGLADRDSSGRWSLTELGRHHLAPVREG